MDKFDKKRGKLGYSQHDLPQFQSHHHGALTNFMNARGVAHKTTEVDPHHLKPTQEYFDPEKVEGIKQNGAGKNAVIATKDGHIVDGHHRWLAAKEENKPVRTIVLDTGIDKALQLTRDFPSTQYRKDGGGVEKIERAEWRPFPGLKIKPPTEELSKEPDIREYQQKRHAAEFEGAPMPEAPRRPVVVDAPLFGGRKELGTLPYDYAGAANTALNSLYNMKTKPFYSNPYTAPFASAIDAYESGKRIQEDPYSISSYTGLLPIARSGSPILGAVGGAGAAYAASQAPQGSIASSDTDAMDASRLAHGLTDRDNFSSLIGMQREPDSVQLPSQAPEPIEEHRAGGGSVNSRIDKNPEWRMSLGRGGEHDVQDALRLARDHMRAGGRPQQIGGYNFHPEFGSDRDALMTTAYAEASGEFKKNPEMRQKAIEAVMHNIQNRALGEFKMGNKSSDAYWKTHDPHSIRDQVLAPKQYSSFNPNSPEVNIAGRNAIKAMQDPAVREEFGRYADNVMGRMTPDPTHGSSNYRNSAHSSQASNKWFNQLQDKVDIGHHTFGRAPGFHVPEDRPTPQLGDTAMMQRQAPTSQAMQMAGLQGDVGLPQGVPSTMMAQAAPAAMPTQAPPTQVAQAAPPPAARPTQIASANTVTPSSAPTPVTPSMGRPSIGADAGVGSASHEPPIKPDNVPAPNAGADQVAPVQAEPPVAETVAAQDTAPKQDGFDDPSFQAPDMMAGLENMFSYARGGAVQHALKIAHDAMEKGGGAWTRKEGQNPRGGLNAKGRASLKAQGHDIKPPQPEGGPRRDSYCARSAGQMKMFPEAAKDPDSRLRKARRAWNCADGGEVWDKPRPKKLGEPKPLSDKQKSSAKAAAKAAGRPWPNMVDNLRAARKD